MEMQSTPQQFTRPPKTLSGERRLRVRRSPVALTCVTLGESDVGVVANISETGMGLTFATPLRENSFSHLCIRLPQLYGAIATHAEIVWITESKKEAGVRFVGLPKEVCDQIRMWVSLARGNRKSEAGEERTHNVEDHLSTVSAAAAMPARPASGESVLQSWRLTEMRRRSSSGCFHLNMAPPTRAKYRRQRQLRGPSPSRRPTQPQARQLLWLRRSPFPRTRSTRNSRGKRSQIEAFTTRPCMRQRHREPPCQPCGLPRRSLNAPLIVASGLPSERRQRVL